MAQYQQDIDNYIDELIFRLVKDCPTKTLNYNGFKGIVLQFTNVDELDAYLVYATGQGISIKDALICANAFFQLRWEQIKLLVENA